MENVHQKIVELVLKQNASTEEILAELKLLEDYKTQKNLNESEIRLAASKLHLELVEDICSIERR